MILAPSCRQVELDRRPTPGDLSCAQPTVAICSYVVIPVEGAAAALAAQLEQLPGCDVIRAQNRDVLILVTDTPGLAEETSLRRSIEALPGIRALLLTFGELDPMAP